MKHKRRAHALALAGWVRLLTIVCASACAWTVGPGTPLAQAQDVAAVASVFYTDTLEVGGVVDSDLSADLSGDALAEVQALPDSVVWTWTASVAGTVSPAGGGTRAAEPSDYAVTVYQYDPAAPDALLDVVFNTAGTYTIAVAAEVSIVMGGQTFDYASQPVSVCGW